MEFLERLHIRLDRVMQLVIYIGAHQVSYEESYFEDMCLKLYLSETG
jgi:hypothetical protein